MLSKILANLKDRPDYGCYQTGDRVYTNRELYKYVCNIYDYLIKNCKRQDRVIVYGHKEIYMVASFLACAFAGITYVPVDISCPKERFKNIVNQVSPRLILDSAAERIMNSPVYTDITDIAMRDEDVYYIIFTSGSTGEPKGIKITYANLKSCTEWLADLCKINGDTVLNQAIFSFDLSVADIYLSLLTGSKHCVIKRETQKDFKRLFSELKSSNAGLAVMTPSYADYLMLDRSFCSELMPRLKTVLFCGETLTEKTVEKLSDRFKGIRIINSYGPSECTFAVTAAVVKPGEEISAGAPKPDVDIYIVDDELNEVESGKTGQILITGKSVGKGYLKEEPNKNAFISYRGKNAYLTGDLAYEKNRNIYFCGRKDNQIKFRGYRIEPDEIEKVLNRPDFVERAVVLTRKNESGGITGISAFVKPVAGSGVTARRVKDYAQEYLPGYMIPTVKIIEEIPLNENGKIDKKALHGG